MIALVEVKLFINMLDIKSMSRPLKSPGHTSVCQARYYVTCDLTEVISSGTLPEEGGMGLIHHNNTNSIQH